MTYDNPTPLDATTVPCHANPDAMFPTSNGPRRAADDYTAKAICRSGNNGQRCPVLDRCLQHALRHDVDGIWAATTPEERQKERRRTGVVPIPVVLSLATMRAYQNRVDGAA